MNLNQIKNRINRNINLLLILLSIDVITTYFLLICVEGAQELNPILNFTDNLILTLIIVLLSHIVAGLLLIYVVKKRISKETNINVVKYTKLFSYALVIYYYIICSWNVVMIILKSN